MRILFMPRACVASCSAWLLSSSISFSSFPLCSFHLRVSRSTSCLCSAANSDAPPLLSRSLASSSLALPAAFVSNATSSSSDATFAAFCCKDSIVLLSSSVFFCNASFSAAALASFPCSDFRTVSVSRSAAARSLRRDAFSSSACLMFASMVSSLLRNAAISSENSCFSSRTAAFCSSNLRSRSFPSSTLFVNSSIFSFASANSL
mmetsp:Transcript_43384/g.101897  ORF Transcript_43384/g.101897 Transcript_43384/m.101897 type:complete len:205 (+) Transcript_43384:343-957(+)